MSINTPRINGQPPVYVGWDNHRGERWWENEDRPCLGKPLEMFYPDDRALEVIAAAKAVCARCPVKDACRDWNLDYEARNADTIYGVVGGLSAGERKTLRRKRQKADLERRKHAA